LPVQGEAGRRQVFMLFGKRKLRTKSSARATSAQPAAEIEPTASPTQQPKPAHDDAEPRPQPDTATALATPFVPGESLPADEVGAILTIDCAALAQNWRTLASRAAPAD
jgi:hypothetical protein